MGPDELLALFGDDPAAAQAAARAQIEAMGRRRAAGTLATIAGGPFAASGKQFSTDAAATQNDLMGAGQFQAGQKLRRLGMDQEAQRFAQAQAAEQARFAATRADAAAARAQAQSQHLDDVRLRQQQLDQGKFTAPVDPITGTMRILDTQHGTFVDQAGGTAPAGPVAPRFANEGQANAYGFAGRIREARKQMDDAGMPSGMSGRWDAAAMGAQTGPLSSLVPQELASEPGSRYYNAARNLVAALLRKESGAAIGKDEWNFALSNYVPTPADSPELRENKRRMLDIMENAMQVSAGASGVRALQAQTQAAPPPAQGPVPDPVGPTSGGSPAPATRVRRYNPQTGKLE